MGLCQMQQRRTRPLQRRPPPSPAPTVTPVPAAQLAGEANHEPAPLSMASCRDKHARICVASEAELCTLVDSEGAHVVAVDLSADAPTHHAKGVCGSTYDKLPQIAGIAVKLKGGQSAARVAGKILKEHCTEGVRLEQLLFCVGMWVRDEVADHSHGAPPPVHTGLLRLLQQRGAAVVCVPAPYTRAHCSRQNIAPGGKLQRCCAPLRQDYLQGRAGTGPVHTVASCPRCDGGRGHVNLYYNGARAIWADVHDLVRRAAGRHDQMTAPPERLELVLPIWQGCEQRERAERLAAARALDA